MTRFEPAAHRPEILGLGVRVSENTVVEPLLQFFDKAVGNAEIHIRYPKRKRVRRHAVFTEKIVFNTVCVASVVYRVEIVLHLCSSFVNKNKTVRLYYKPYGAVLQLFYVASLRPLPRFENFSLVSFISLDSGLYKSSTATESNSVLTMLKRSAQYQTSR